MRRKFVSSSYLESVGYDASSATLEVEFTDGAIYQYFNVPERIYQNLMEATSHGRYFYDYIRDSFTFRAA